MRIVAITSALILALAVLGGAAAATPKRTTLTGKITVLKVKQISIHGARNLTCRITTVSPRVRPLGLALGAKVKITCVRGILSAIKPMTTAGTVTPSGTTTTDNTLPSDPPGGTGGVKVAPTVNGAGTITALGGGQIEFGKTITCVLGSNSPGTSGYRVGAHVNYTCVAGSLTAISASEA